MDNEEFNPLPGIHEEVDVEGQAARKRYEEEYKEALRFVISDRRGRTVLFEVLRRAHVFDGGFIADGNAMYFKEGARANGVQLFNDVWEADPNAYTTMLKERMKES